MIRIVYVAGPYRADTTFGIACNIHAARAVGVKVAQEGAMPLIPHSNTAHFDGVAPDKLWLEGGLELLRRSDVVILVGGWEQSSGTLAEMREAQRLGIPVFHTIDELRKWLASVPESLSEPLSQHVPSLSTSETEPPLESLPALTWSCTDCGQQFGKDNQPSADCPDCGSRFARFTGLEEIADGNG